MTYLTWQQLPIIKTKKCQHTFIDWDSVWNTISGIQNDTGGSARCVQGQDSLDGDVHGGCVEGLEHDLGHLLPVGLGVKGGFSQEDGVFLWCDTKLIVEGMMPDLLHVIPVCDDTVFNGVLQGQDTSLGLGLISYIGVLEYKFNQLNFSDLNDHFK